jgi:cytochrome c554/c'-like protein
MARRVLILVSLAPFFAACSGGGGGGGSTSAPSTGTAPTQTQTQTQTTPVSSSTFPTLAVAREVTTGRFATSSACFQCHSNRVAGGALRDDAGRGVAPFDLWQASMMANAARDPLFLAEVSVEIAATPSLRSAIETKCIGCHSPMAKAEAADAGETLSFADLEKNTDRAQLALDGVSCTACHQMVPAANVEDTFDGNFTMNRAREIYGPHDAPHGQPMSVRTGYQPTKGDHILRSAQCASCHTLRTHAVRADGTATGGRLPEQTPYLEWQNSVYNDEVASPAAEAVSCQGCHTPKTDADGNGITTKIAEGGFPIQPRTPIGRHLFLGGNTLIPQILRDQRAKLNPLAPDAALTEVVAQTRDQLQRRTARLSVGAITRSGTELRIPLQVENLTGHKLPTGHPIRRAWLRLRVRGANGALVFESGAYDASGQILGGGVPLSSEAAGGPWQAHRDTITSGSQVQIYESLMADVNGDLTYLLLRGETYLKDNRLLPKGWNPSHPNAAEAGPVGTSVDTNFAGGVDEVTYLVTADPALGPFSVEAEFLYEPLSVRFANELFSYSTREVEAFKSYYQAADRTPEVLARASSSAP